MEEGVGETTIVVRKRFWADRTWLSVLFLAPLSLGLAFLGLILLFGAYAGLLGSPVELRVGLFFFVFGLLAFGAAALLVRSIAVSLFERMEFSKDGIRYVGFGAYVLPYREIRRVTLKERRGMWGHERFLFFVGAGAAGTERFYLIPRWHSFTDGLLSRILGERMKISIIDRGLLSFYAALPGKDWALYVVLLVLSVFSLLLFGLAKSAPETFGLVAIFVWLLSFVAASFLLFHHFRRKREVVL